MKHVLQTIKTAREGPPDVIIAQSDITSQTFRVNVRDIIYLLTLLIHKLQPMTDLFCPTFASSGVCNDPTCGLNHTNCVLCQLNGLSRSALWAHMQLQLHRKRLRGYYGSMNWTCPICNITMKLLSQAPHEAGQHHRHNLTLLAAQQTPQGGGQGRSVPAASTAHLPSRAGASEAPPATAGRATMVECPLCDRSIPLTKWNEHLHDPMHARKAKLAAFHQALEEGSRDKFGVNIVQAELDFGVIDVSSLSEWPTREDVFYIRLEEGPIKLEDVRLTSRLSSLSQYRDAK